MFGIFAPRTFPAPPPPLPRWVSQSMAARELRLAMLRGGSTFEAATEAVRIAFPLVDPVSLERLAAQDPDA